MMVFLLLTFEFNNLFVYTPTCYNVDDRWFLFKFNEWIKEIMNRLLDKIQLCCNKIMFKNISKRYIFIVIFHLKIYKTST